MRFDHLAGTASAVGILLILALVLWTGLWGPVWQAAWEMKPSDAVGIITNAVGWVVTLGVGGWAYYGTRQQLAIAQKQIDDERERTRLTSRKLMDVEVSNLNADIDRLLTARGYLGKFEERFPPSGNLDGYARSLFLARNDAMDFTSQSAATAPFGYGEIVTTVMRRIQMLGERLDQKANGMMPSSGLIDYYAPLVKEAVMGIRSIISQIDDQVPKRQDQLLKLMDARDQL